MKMLRYLLIVVAAIAVIHVNAQSFAQMPTAEFHSTSSMVGSGTHIPLAVSTGTYTTYDAGYNPSKANMPSIRKTDYDGDGIDDDEVENEDDPDNPGEPFPIGDAVLPLLLLAIGYAA